MSYFDNILNQANKSVQVPEPKEIVVQPPESKEKKEWVEKQKKKRWKKKQWANAMNRKL